MSEFSVNWTDASGVAKSTTVTVSDNTADASLPVILLLHGAGGNIHHMADPATSPGMMFDVSFVPEPLSDRGWHPYPNVGLWSISTSPQKSGSGLQGALAQFGYKALNYGQVGPNDSVNIPAVELDAVMREVLARFNKRVVLVCHSRGGLLARHFLQRNRNNLDVLNRIAGVVTLHTPHQGSEVADFAASVHNALMQIRNDNKDNVSLVSVIDYMDAQVNNPCIAELRPSSTFLSDLRGKEITPLPVPIPIHTFGGTNPRLISVFLSIFDAMSAVPQWHLPPFHWSTFPVDAVDALDGTPVSLICPEERAGGDVLVTDIRSHLPGEISHHVNGVNHANVLCDGNVQAQLQSVLSTLRSNAAYVTQTVSPSMIKGSTYPVSITMKNTGSSTWISGGNYPFRLEMPNPQDGALWGISRKELPGPIPPGATATFNFNVTAPATAGNYHLQWRMLQENVEWFGATTDAAVMVTQAGSVTGMDITPASVTSGNYVTIQVNLASAAPVGGVSVMLSSSKPAVILPPSLLVVPAGQTSASVMTRAASVAVSTSVTLTATLATSTASRSVGVSPSSAYPYGTAMAVGVGGSLL